MKLRPYQQQASDAFVDALKVGLHPAVALPTGSGKSLVIADLCAKMSAKGGNIVVLAHVQELLKQNSDEYERFTGLSNHGIYSAGLNRQDTGKQITFAGIQSVYKKPLMFANADLILVDEAHTVPPDGEGLMYTNFFAALPNARRGGVTATPWRLDGGAIYGDGKPFDALAYSKSPLDLVEEGWLSPLVGVDTAWQLNLKGVSKTGGDYNQGQVQDKIQDGTWLKECVSHAKKHLKGRKHIAVFLPTIDTAKQAAEEFTKQGISCGIVSSMSDDRDEQLTAWKGGEIKAMANVDILTTGFNFPALDAIVCLRPTQSTGLWVQMLGRGMRLAEGKENCLILDYVGNLSRLGGVSSMETWSKEKQDGKMETTDGKKAASAKPVKRLNSNIVLSTLDPMLEAKGGLTVCVRRVSYACRPGRRAGKQLMLAVYDCETDEGVAISVNQFVCVEYDGGARYHAQQWFKRRGASAPFKARDAMIDAYSLPSPKKLRVHKAEGYINVLTEYF